MSLHCVTAILFNFVFNLLELDLVVNNFLLLLADFLKILVASFFVSMLLFPEHSFDVRVPTPNCKYKSNKKDLYSLKTSTRGLVDVLYFIEK